MLIDLFYSKMMHKEHKTCIFVKTFAVTLEKSFK